ncbi:diguanylate cyclase [Alicycliphilus sp. T452]|jgi:diguanylate cyclase (GGDEF)-like protein
MGWKRYGLGVLRRALWAALCGTAPALALACEGAQHIHLRQPVPLSPQEKAEFRALAPLRVLSSDAPPMARYDQGRGTYTGISVDVWCFIARELGLRYEIVPDQGLTLADKLQQVQAGRADVFMPLSLQPERARLGLFTRPYYESYYAVIARKGQHLSVHGLGDLAHYRVGTIKGVALEAALRNIVPAAQLAIYAPASNEGLYRPVRDGSIDVAVFNRSMFTEDRYRYEYFDLEVIHTLREDPRAYRFYFSPSPQHQRIVAAFDRYLAALDVSASITAHEDGERQFLERYMAQRGQRTILQAASVAAAVLVLVFGLAFMRYRRMARLLAGSNQQIRQQQQALEAANRNLGQLNQSLEQLSLSDSLTGLANRRAFDLALQREHARRQRTGSPLSVLLVDVDHFKSVNDHYGHATGDDYLRAVAQVLRKTVTRPTDLAARHGGEEFACLLPQTAAGDACRVAERIRQATARLALPNALAGGKTLTVSIGVATLAQGHASAQELLEQADARLYAAKRAGRNRIQAVEL